MLTLADVMTPEVGKKIVSLLGKKEQLEPYEQAAIEAPSVGSAPKAVAPKRGKHPKKTRRPLSPCI